MEILEAKTEQAKCRGCGRVLKGKPYYLGGRAYHPDTGEQCPINYYGGFVCSESCDERACLELEKSMPGHTGQWRIGDSAQAKIRRNWEGD